MAAHKCAEELTCQSCICYLLPLKKSLGSNTLNWSASLSCLNWFAIYSFIAEVFFSYRIYIVPLHQNSRLRYANFIFPHFWYIIRLLFPFKYPINPATLILGGILGQGISRLLLLLRLSIGITFAKFHVFLFVSLHKILSACTSVRTRCDTYNSISYVLYCLWYYFALAL